MFSVIPFFYNLNKKKSRICKLLSAHHQITHELIRTDQVEKGTDNVDIQCLVKGCHNIPEDKVSQFYRICLFRLFCNRVHIPAKNTRHLNFSKGKKNEIAYFQDKSLAGLQSFGNRGNCSNVNTIFNSKYVTLKDCQLQKFYLLLRLA